MARVKGAKNIVQFCERRQIETTATKDILLLTKERGCPLTYYNGLLNNQENFLYWIANRHEQLQKTRNELASLKEPTPRKGPKGPKDATFRKYKWYAERLLLLEAINNLEVFYKRTFIALGNVLHEFISAGKVKGAIDAKVLWSLTDDINVPSLIFENQLFHNIETINEATKMLVGKIRYQNKSHITRCIKAVFQIRHTLSHNSGLVTDIDATKFKILRFEIKPNEVIDPASQNLSSAIFKFLRQEAKEFTDWLRSSTIEFLKGIRTNPGLQIPASKKEPLQRLLGGDDTIWNEIPWV